MFRSALYATAAGVLALVLGLPLMVVLLLSPATSAASCAAGQPAGPGPSSVNGVPTQYLPYYSGASSYFQLGANGWAYLAAINNAESTFGTNNGPGTGVLSGSNSAGAAGPMQIGIGGRATDNWDTVTPLIPATLAGGVQPPSVYNEADAVYGAAALLSRWGAPGDWQTALQRWNNFPPEITQINQLVAQYTSTTQTSGTVAAQGSTSGSGAPTTPPVASASGSGGRAGVDQAGAAAYVDGLTGVKVGFAVVTAGGQVLAQDNAAVQVPGASITKAMLLVAYLDKVGSAAVDPAARAHLQAMIEESSNPDGNWVYAQVGAPAVQRVAAAAGMTGFVLDTSDPAYTLGQSLVTAGDFARFFATVDQLMPAANRAYGIGLLENISAADHWGILDANVGVTASKAGWKTEHAGWVVNQAGQLQVGGQTAGIAIVSEGESSQTAGETIMQTVASDLLAASSQPAGAGGQCATVSGPTVPGAVAQIQPDGTAAIPSAAPPQVQQTIAAGNRIIHTFYSQERRANMLTQVQDSYDCSGSVDWVLYNAGLGNTPLVDVGAATAGDSTLLEQYGQNGPGQWITVYGSANHAFIQVAGILLDTSYQGASVTPSTVPDSYPPGDPLNGGPHSGPRWVPVSSLQSQLHDGNAWSIRHPPGL